MALRLVPALFVSIAVLGEPVGATLLGWLVLGEAPTVNVITGGILIITGIVIVLSEHHALDKPLSTG